MPSPARAIKSRVPVPFALSGLGFLMGFPVPLVILRSELMVPSLARAIVLSPLQNLRTPLLPEAFEISLDGLVKSELCCYVRFHKMVWRC